jgi:hypothetical protein
MERNTTYAVAPKGLKDSARGFNPWKRVNIATSPEGAEDICEKGLFGLHLCSSGIDSIAPSGRALF